MIAFELCGIGMLLEIWPIVLSVIPMAIMIISLWTPLNGGFKTYMVCCFINISIFIIGIFFILALKTSERYMLCEMVFFACINGAIQLSETRGKRIKGNDEKGARDAFYNFSIIFSFIAIWSFFIFCGAAARYQCRLEMINELSISSFF